LIKGNIMKRAIFLLTAILALTVFFAGCTMLDDDDGGEQPPSARPSGPNPLRAIIDHTYDYLNENGTRHPTISQTWVGVDIVNIIPIWEGVTYSSTIEMEATVLNRYYGLMVFLLYLDIDSVMIGQPHYRGMAWMRLRRYLGNGIVASTVMGINQAGNSFVLSH